MIAENLAQFNAMRKCSSDESEAKSRLMSAIDLSLMREIEELKESKRKMRSLHKDRVKEAFLAGFEAGRDSEGQYLTDELLDSAYERYLKL